MVRASIARQAYLTLVYTETGEPVTLATPINTALKNLPPQFLANLEFDLTIYYNAYVHIPAGISKWEYLEARHMRYQYVNDTWRYRANGQAERVFQPSEILHIRKAGPVYYRTPVAVEPALALLPYAEAAYNGVLREARAQKAHMTNSRSLVWLDKKDRWSGEAIKTLRRWLNGGIRKTHLVAEGRAGHIVIGGNSDPDFIAKQEELVKQTARVMDVPSALLDDLSDATYSNFSNIRREWAQRVIPEMMRTFEDAFSTSKVVNVPAGMAIVMDTSTIPELKDDIDAVIDRAIRLVEASDAEGNPIFYADEAREMISAYLEIEIKTNRTSSSSNGNGNSTSSDEEEE